jgi:hypothetical protein
VTRTSVASMTLALAGVLALNAPLMRPPTLTRDLPEKLRGDPDAMDEREGERARERDRAPDNRVARPGPDLGPAAYADEQYALRAYPASEIPFSATVAAQQAFRAVAARGAGHAGTWSLYGPSTSVVPSTLSFYGGGPLARYITSGRITSLAIAPTCTAGDCVVLLGAAGGGIWRTERALAGTPVWRHVSEEIPSNAIGSIERDPNDPSGKTYYAGTGEAHASGDSAAGIGLFR